ncbi:hypothetical protein NL676_007123 [Syzygium grande]|nr:hypothetical protein NL676_007123 [Syzygium grande]
MEAEDTKSAINSSKTPGRTTGATLVNGTLKFGGRPRDRSKEHGFNPMPRTPKDRWQKNKNYLRLHMFPVAVGY